ncbi:hypothetical protein BV504_16830 [Halomonas sp. 'Soap Lake |nr:hypothetical protein B2G49_16980 [Halomonas sp. 'Soap Lake \
MALVLKIALETALETVLKIALKKKVLKLTELAVTIYLQGVRKMQRPDLTPLHFELGVTISLQLRLACLGDTAVNMI